MKTISADSLDQPPPEHSSTYLQRERWTRQQVEDYQAQALQTCRAYAYAHSPFYQRFHRGLMDRPLQELPVLTKALIMEHFDELVTDRAVHLQDVQQYLTRANTSTPFLGRYQVTASSGSTGQPGIFLADRTEGVSLGNSYIRSLSWGRVMPESRVAVVTTTDPAQLTTQAPIIVDGQAAPRLQLSSSDPLETLVQRLNEFQPNTLLSYPSIAAMLVNEQRQGRLRIAPRTIFCAAETLMRETRRRMEKTWQTEPFDIYATTEGGVLAMECSHHQGLHIFEDFTILEIVDRDNRPVPPGEQGDKVLLTVLFRRTQPLIRYEITDLVRSSTHERCPCGSPFTLLEAIEGRKGDLLYFPTLAGGEEGISRIPFEIIIARLPVSGWQIVQELDGLHVFLTGASEDVRDETLLDTLRQMLTCRGVIVPVIEIHRVTTLIKTARGKTPLLISHVSHHSA